MKVSVKIVLLTLVLYGCTLTRLPTDRCSEFRSGRYIYKVYNQSGLGHWTELSYFITRNDSLEMVTSAHFPQDTAIKRIIWTGSCEYKSVLLNPATNLDSFMVQQYPDGTRHAIVNVADDYFIIKNYGRKDTIWKVR